MELILWRHAEAEPGLPDIERRLTARGRKQASRMAGWLDSKLPGNCKILVSPAARTVETAEALGRKFKIIPELASGLDAGQLLALANWPDSREPVLVVGHQPTLGQVAALLISGVAQDWAIRKANAWWIAQKDHGDNASNFLKVVMAPTLIGK